MTTTQRSALKLLVDRGWSGEISSGASKAAEGRRPQIHWKTAICLWREGLIDIEAWDRHNGLDLEEQPETDGHVCITAAGLAAVSGGGDQSVGSLADRESAWGCPVTVQAGNERAPRRLFERPVCWICCGTGIVRGLWSKHSDCPNPHCPFRRGNEPT